MTETKPLAPPSKAIDAIVNSDAQTLLGASLAAFSYPDSHPAVALWMAPERGAIPRIRAAMDAANAHPSRTVIVVPYAQLLPLVSRLWARRFPQGFLPRFETTMNWSAALQRAEPQGIDITFEVALDLLSAQTMLAGAGLAAHQDSLAGLLVQAAHQLAPSASACPPAERAEWARQARLAAVLGMDAPTLQLEAAVARVAVEWAALSGYGSDVLFEPARCGEVDLVVFVDGLTPDPLIGGLQAVWGARMTRVPLTDRENVGLVETTGVVALHACLDSEDEAARAAACVLQQIEVGRFPLALISADRALTRRVRAMLDARGVQIRDETGWKLSTSAAAAGVMALLHAGTWNASTDHVLAWLKCLPAEAAVVTTLEGLLRREGIREWRAVKANSSVKKDATCQSLCDAVDAWGARCSGRKSLLQWLSVLRSGMETWDRWEWLFQDGPGAKVAQILRLVPASVSDWEQHVSQSLWAERRLELAEFTHWVNQALESASFQPDYPDVEQVVVLPMSQMLGRPFAAAVLAGCDEVRLNPCVDPPGGWTPAQRAALSLPSRDALEQASRLAWQYALQTPHVDILWRTSDDAGEALMPSVLVQLLQWENAAAYPIDPRVAREIAPTPTVRPLPDGSQLPLQRWSASAYEDLRQCPYRFFALRQLGLRGVDELEGELDKRDFGVWLHDVLRSFHESLSDATAPLHTDTQGRAALLDQASDEVTRSMGLAEGEFLPFAAAWPAVRDGYLQWLQEHESQSASFHSAETSHVQRVGVAELVGRIDRIDTLPDGEVLVMDYKTEPLARTRARVKEPLEDTQMAFYAALLPNDTLRGMYVNVGERDGTKACEQLDLVNARDALIEGLLHDVQAIAGGQVLPPLGQGVACDYCDARGLCRKDDWTAA